jgi:hypothetical protein
MIRPALPVVLLVLVVAGCSSGSPGGSGTSLCPSKTAPAGIPGLPTAARGAAPRVSNWHGDADYIVRPMNEGELVKQWTGVAGVASAAPLTETVGGATHAEHTDASGVVRVESWLVKGMAHGVALDPRAGCGTAGAYLHGGIRSGLAIELRRS